jgi:predicted aminopeptidase
MTILIGRASDGKGSVRLAYRPAYDFSCRIRINVIHEQRAYDDRVITGCSCTRPLINGELHLSCGFKMIRRIFFIFLFVLFVLVVWNWSLLVYGINQGIGQLRIVWNAKPIEEVMRDPAFPDSLKQKLKLIDEVRKFAIDSLGLKDTDNYKTLFDQKGEELMWVVTACAPFELKPKTWTFPIVGEVPYKGFFDKEKAKKERDRLVQEGFDVSVRNPGGWSTLGWFKDPILSEMLKRSEGDLASLIIHEMVHATLWVKDSVDFNENLASFIGDTAAYDFLAYKYGKQSKAYTTYLYEDQDYRKFSKYILMASGKLDSLYQTLQPDESVDEKKKKKEAMMKAIVQNMDTLKLELNKNPSKRYEKRLPNNTYFMAYRHYQSKQTTFKEDFDQRYHGDLRAYVKFLSTKYPVL